MLKLSGVVKSIPFEFTEMDNTVHELEVTEFTVADIKRLIEMQRPIVKDDDMSEADKGEILIVSRAVCAVKLRGSSEHYWNDIVDFTEKNYPRELLNGLSEVITELNPVASVDLDEKKSKS